MPEGEAMVIQFPIKFVVTSENTDKVKEQMKEASTETTEGTKKDEKESLKDKEQDETLDKLKEFLDTTDKKGLQTLSKFANNPSNLVQNELLSTLGKAGIGGAIAVAIIALVIASPEVIIAITKALAVKGSMLNQDFHRFFTEEGQLGLARDMQYRRAAGLDVIITNDDRGFILQDPGFVNNSLVDVETTRSIRTSSNESQYGYESGM